MTTNDAYSREFTSFHSHGVRCAADVYRPARQSGPAPVIVMAHGFGSVRLLRLPAYAERFAAAGYVVVLFDYRYFGDSDGTPRQLLDIPSQLDDWRAAIRWARTLDDVDSTTVIGWGTSFAGGHVLTLAAEGVDFSAVVAQVPHVSGPAAVRATGLRQSLRVAPVALQDTWRGLRDAAPRYVDSVGRPGSVAAMTTEDADPALERMTAAAGLTRGEHPETVAARVLLRIGLYSPGRRAGRITCPTLIQVADDDAIAPADAARKVADRIPSGRFKTYPGGHFEPYLEPLFPQVVGDQLDFLATALAPR
ncbi:alpha/beta hydrolase [Gordonia sp. NPDC058843]|uniref:alpha/beta hydrolase n=1 Tax=Gordonia sp. NPDC058843 TaxID=3346648 RepID=UPI003691E658